MLGQVYVMFCGLSRFFLKRMNHENRLGKFG